MKYPVKVAIFLALSLAAIALLEREKSRATFEAWNRTSLDWLVANAMGKIEKPAVTLLRIDPTELRQEELDPRLDWAIVLRSLEDFAPVSVGIVPALQWDNINPLTEGALRKRVLLMPEMALGTVFGKPSGANPNLDPTPFVHLTEISGDLSAVPQIEAIVAMPDDELLINGRPGFTHIELQEELTSGINGISVPLIARVGDAVVPSFILQLIMLQEKTGPENVRIALDGPRPSITLADRYVIPIDPSGHFTVYHGVKDSFPSIDFTALALAVSPFEDVARELRKTSQDTLDSLRSNAVVIGFDDEELRQFELPTGERVARAELLAMAAATIQSGRHITFWPRIYEFISWGVLLLLGSLALLGRKLRVFTAALAIFLLYVVVSLLVFKGSLSWTTPWAGFSICALLALLALLLPSPAKKSSSPVAPEPSKAEQS